MSKLRYVGTAFLPGVPARDLDEAEVKDYGEKELIASGLYEPVGRDSKATKPLPPEPTIDDKEGE